MKVTVSDSPVHTIRSLTVQGEWDRRDSRTNPTKGQWLKFHFGLGDFVSDGSAETIHLMLKVKVRY
jgi:hypothetical protein